MSDANGTVFRARVRRRASGRDQRWLGGRVGSSCGESMGLTQLQSVSPTESRLLGYGLADDPSDRQCGLDSAACLKAGEKGSTGCVSRDALCCAVAAGTAIIGAALEPARRRL